MNGFVSKCTIDEPENDSLMEEANRSGWTMVKAAAAGRNSSLPDENKASNK